MDGIHITTANVHDFRVGDKVHIALPRPAWWRLIALWRWYKAPKFYTITSVESATMAAVSPLNTGAV